MDALILRFFLIEHIILVLLSILLINSNKRKDIEDVTIIYKEDNGTYCIPLLYEAPSIEDLQSDMIFYNSKNCLN